MKIDKILINVFGIAFALSMSYLIYGAIFGMEKYTKQEEVIQTGFSFGVQHSYTVPIATGKITTEPYGKMYKAYLDNHFRMYISKKQLDYCTPYTGEYFMSCALFYRGCQYKKKFDECMKPLQDI